MIDTCLYTASTAMNWLCQRCGHPHEYNTPPCNECGHRSFVKEVEQKAPEDEGPATTTQWVCPDCGREHPTNSPPCSRCAHPTLEEETIEFDDEEFTAPSYRELADVRYVVAGVVAVALLGAVLLGAAGVLSIPGFGGETGSIPTLQNVPGDATTADGIALADVETSYLAAINDNRTAAGRAELQRSDRLDEIATFANQRRVKQREGGGDVPDTQLGSLLDEPCPSPTIIQFQLPSASLLESDDEAAGEAARRIARFRFEEVDNSLPDAKRVGLDVHAAPSGRYYVTQLTC